jgi:hypothetical protein
MSLNKGLKKTNSFGAEKQNISSINSEYFVKISTLINNSSGIKIISREAIQQPSKLIIIFPSLFFCYLNSTLTVFVRMVLVCIYSVYLFYMTFM